MSNVVTACPACGAQLKRLTPRDFNNPYLNEDQAESQYAERAGDWYCKADGCTGPKRGKSGFSYFWDSEVLAPTAPEPTPTPARSEAAGGEELPELPAEIEAAWSIYAERMNEVRRVPFADVRGTEKALGDAAADLRRVIAGAVAVVFSLRQQLAAAREDGAGLTPIAYRVSGSPLTRDEVTIKERSQRDGTVLWGVYDAVGACLNRDGEWEYEPLPSSRGDAFIARTRFATVAEAATAARSEPGGEHGGGNG